MNVAAPTYISLYSGGGGLDIGFRMAVPEARAVCYVEHEASAAALLVDHMQAGLLDDAPCWTDALTFNSRPWRGRVDWLIGGPPCQPFSAAGKLLGADDPRNMWPVTLRMVAEIQPVGCFFENVPSADSLWYVYENVIPGLSALGYTVEAGIFSALEVGAPHQRERIFILAHDFNRRRGERPDEAEPQQQAPERRFAPESGGGAMADTAGVIWQRSIGSGIGGWQPEGTAGDDCRERHVGHADGAGLPRRSQPYREGGYERPAWPPGPADTDAWAAVLAERPDLAPAVESTLRDVAHGLAGGMAGLSRSQRLRILGNGVVPRTAALAYRTLAERSLT